MSRETVVDKCLGSRPERASSTPQDSAASAAQDADGGSKQVGGQGRQVCQTLTASWRPSHASETLLRS
jgi:hypothetical protein